MSSRRDAVGGLGEIVGAEAEELGLFGDLVGGEGGARQLDHGAHHVVDRGALLLEDLCGDAADDGGLIAHLLDGADQRNHDFEVRIAALVLDVDGGLEDGARLHLGDLGEGDAEAAAAQAEHGVGLVQLLDARQQRAQFLELGRAGLGVFQVRDLDQQIFALGQELVQRRIEQADGDGQRLHGLEEADEVGALHGQQLLERVAAVLLVVGENHGAHVLDAVFGKEHVLGAAEADAFGAEEDGLLGVAGNVGVGADPAACAPGRPSS